MSPLAASPKTFRVKGKVHAGGAIVRFARFYPFFLDALLELVKNSLDAGASKIDVFINKMKRIGNVTDNGRGVSLEEFEEAINKIANEVPEEETGKDGKMGRFRIGLMAFVGKCREYKVVSTSVLDTQGKFYEWTFNSEEIAKMEDFSLPCCEIPEMRKHQSWWRTQACISDYTTDKGISAIDLIELREEILEHFNESLQRNKTKINLVIVDEKGVRAEESLEGREYLGEKVVDLSRAGKTCGNVKLTLHVATEKSDKRVKPKIRVGDFRSDFKVNLTKVFSTSRKGISPVVVEALSSGTLEGRILVDKIGLDENRKTFIPDDRLLDFYTVLEAWYHESGHQHFNRVREESQMQLYQKLGKESISEMELLLRRRPHLLKVLNFAKVRVSRTIDPNRNVVDVTEEAQGGTPTGRVGGKDGPRVPVGGGGGGCGGGGKHPPGIKPSGVLFVHGPKGDPQALVKEGGDPIIRITYDRMPGDSRPFVFEKESGILRINIRHTFWEMVEDKNTNIKRYQEYLLSLVLNFEASTEGDLGLNARTLMENLLDTFVHMMVENTAFAKLVPARRVNG